ncbi:MAG: cyclic pyranopterin monophosphate synthase MoaC [Chitinophagales bacterium]|nr:cyclic pyranopterin monophosphate synthase MoaC [Hyphomicrobiales bacterium]
MTGYESPAALLHLNERGEAVMVDISAKASTERIAVAEGYVTMNAATLAIVERGDAKKGDVLAAARIAGIMGAKKTADLIPLCHPLPLSKVTVDFVFRAAPPSIRVEALAKTTGQTGVEMEALTAVTIACLTLYDMLKAADKDMRIEGVRLLEKTGGRSGHYRAPARE